MCDPQAQPASSSAPRKNFLRSVALGSSAVFLVASSYQASFALSRIGKPISHIDQYGGGGGGGNNDDSGLSAGEAAGIGVGVAALGAGIYFLSKDKKEKDGEDAEKSASAGSAEALPAGVREFSGVRVTPGRSELSAGGTCIFDLQVRSKADGKWYSVTGRSEAQIALKGAQQAVVPVDGVKNTFCVPISAPRSADGKMVSVVGTFSPKGSAPLSAEAQLQIRVQPVNAFLSSR